MIRALVVTVVLAFAGLLALDLEAGPSRSRAEAASAPAPVRVVTVAKPRTVEVAFVRRGRLVLVERVVPKGVTPAAHAIRELVIGPTRVERRKGIRSALRDDVRLRFLRPDGDLWQASFSRSLLVPGTAQKNHMRLTQIEATLDRLDAPMKQVAISLSGRLATVLPIGPRPGSWSAVEGEGGYVYSVRGVQRRLLQLGYLSPSQVTGQVDYSLSQALLAFQGWEGLYRSGTITGEVQIRLVRADRPRARIPATGKHVEIHRDRGVLLAFENGELFRAVHTSTGAGGGTPYGTFRVYRKETMSWSVPFSVWMPYASYFTGGIAMHQYPDVPSYPASHGCVRLPAGDAQRVYLWASIGTPVRVF